MESFRHIDQQQTKHKHNPPTNHALGNNPHMKTTNTQSRPHKHKTHYTHPYITKSTYASMHPLVPNTVEPGHKPTVCNPYRTEYEGFIYHVILLLPSHALDIYSENAKTLSKRYSMKAQSGGYC